MLTEAASDRKSESGPPAEFGPRRAMSFKHKNSSIGNKINQEILQQYELVDTSTLNKTIDEPGFVKDVNLTEEQCKRPKSMAEKRRKP